MINRLGKVENGLGFLPSSRLFVIQRNVGSHNGLVLYTQDILCTVVNEESSYEMT